MKLPYLVAAIAGCLPSFVEDTPSVENVAADSPEETIKIIYHKEGDHSFPDFTFTDINPKSQTYQQRMSLDGLLGNGTPVVLNFWEPWCYPCLLEMPDLERMHQSGNAVVVGLSREGYQVFSPELRESNRSASVFENAEKVLASITYPLLGSATEDQKMKTLFQTPPYRAADAIPLTIIIRPNGIVDGYYRGSDLTLYETLSGFLQQIK